MESGKDEKTQLAAAKELLDRGAKLLTHNPHHRLPGSLPGIQKRNMLKILSIFRLSHGPWVKNPGSVSKILKNRKGQSFCYLVLDRGNGRPAQSIEADMTIESNPLADTLKAIAETGPFDDMPDCD